MGDGTRFGRIGEAAGRLQPSSLALGIAAIVLVLDLLVLVLAGMSLHGSRQQAYLRAEIVSRNMSAILAETVAGYFDRIDLALQLVAEHASLNGGTSPQVAEILAKARQRVPEALFFNITDRDGIAAVQGGAKGDLSLADRDYFVALRDQPDDRLVISNPLFGRASKEWVIVLARRIAAPDGSFAGIAYAPLPVRTLSALFAGVDLRQDDAIALRGPLPSLGAIARFPETVGGVPAVGNPSVSAELQEMTAIRPFRGTYVARAAIDGVERVLSYHKLKAYPYYQLVGISTEQMMAQWWRESAKVIALTAVFLVMVTAGGLFAYFSLRELRGALSVSQELGAALTRRNDDLARFADILAHHMQEPVRQQHIFAQDLARKLPQPLSAELAQSLGAIVDAARRHRTLLGDAQRYLAVDAQGVSTVPAPGEAALERALHQLAGRIAAANATVEHAPLPVLPIATAALAEVFAALIDNAVAYARPEVPPRIQITAERRDGEVVVSVSDNGVGIPAEFRERVFKVFERLDPRHSGTGIGLALAKKIVELAGGRIWIDQPNDCGTRVCFALPAGG